MTVVVELEGLEVFGYHGVREEERREGRTFLYDVRLEVPDTAGAETDRIEDAVDYRDVAACVREISESRSFRLLEALATAVADGLVGAFPVERARVRVRKPGVRPAGLPTEFSGATAERVR
jgi:dihydroneopterin aldolase